MPIDPRIEMFFATMVDPPSTEDGQPARLRAEAHAVHDRVRPFLTSPGPRTVDIADDMVPVEGGMIRVRLYRPGGDTPAPVHVYLHGGGWWQGTLDHVDPECRRMSAAAGCVLVSVDYRLAPEHRFPTPLEDCYAALLWVVEQANRLGLDTQRLSIGGSSAGGNLAAAVTLLARDRGGPPLVAQVLEVPAVDLTMSHPSIDEMGEHRALLKQDLVRAVDFYLGHETDPMNPWVSPYYADLKGLPPALIMTAEFDPLRDEGEAYGRRLQEAGVPVIVHRWPGMTHGSTVFDMIVPEIADAHDREIADFLRCAYETARSGSVTTA